MATEQKPAQQSGASPVTQQQTGQTVPFARPGDDMADMPRQQAGATQFTDWASI